MGPSGHVFIIAAALTSGLAASSSVMFASRHGGGNYDYGKGKSFRGGSKSSRDNWYGYNDSDFQRWWHRSGKQDWGIDIQNAEMAGEVYQTWVDLGKPKVK